ncbi:hypothetical protein ABZ605_38070 [Streptomyces sp. NPDC012765]|uniref:hypothetical protein n=1 Tax=Streptomyces sp. NPDC012765 TaxID=3155249 RepID=UPI0033EB44B9
MSTGRAVYLDTEFDPRNPTLSGLLSIGLTDNTNPAADYYAINTDADLDALADHTFIVEHVLPFLPVSVDRHPDGSPAGIHWAMNHPDFLAYAEPAAQIAEDLAAYFPGDEEPELWANWGKDDLGYLHRLFGNDWEAMPAGVPRLFFDLEVRRRQLGAPKPPVQLADEHHALADARFNRDFHTHLLRFEQQQCLGAEELAQHLYAATTDLAGRRTPRPARAARPAGTPRPAWTDLSVDQRSHHIDVAGALLQRVEVIRPQDGR